MPGRIMGPSVAPWWTTGVTCDLPTSGEGVHMPVRIMGPSVAPWWTAWISDSPTWGEGVLMPVRIMGPSEAPRWTGWWGVPPSPSITHSLTCQEFLKNSMGRHMRESLGTGWPARPPPLGEGVLMPSRIMGPSGAPWRFTGGTSGSPLSPEGRGAHTPGLKSAYEIFH